MTAHLHDQLDHLHTRLRDSRLAMFGLNRLPRIYELAFGWLGEPLTNRWLPMRLKLTGSPPVTSSWMSEPARGVYPGCCTSSAPTWTSRASTSRPR